MRTEQIHESRREEKGEGEGGTRARHCLPSSLAPRRPQTTPPARSERQYLRGRPEFLTLTTLCSLLASHHELSAPNRCVHHEHPELRRRSRPTRARTPPPPERPTRVQNARRNDRCSRWCPTKLTRRRPPRSRAMTRRRATGSARSASSVGVGRDGADGYCSGGSTELPCVLVNGERVGVRPFSSPLPPR